MAKRIGGARRKTRHKFKKPLREKGKLSITKYLQEFKVNEKVTLLADPAVQKGIYARRFHGKRGIITGKQGKCYIVEVKDQHLSKSLIIHPVHLRK